MKYSAEFDSVNTAEIAAAAIKKQISPFSDINIKPNKEIGNNDNNSLIIFGNYNPSSATPPYAAVNTVYAINDASEQENNDDSGAVLEIQCRSEDAKSVSRLLIGYGGRNISNKS